MARRPVLLTIGGNDPTGGAGIQADLKTFAVHGGYGLAVIAALIAGSTTELRSLQTLAVDFVGDQLDVLLSDITVDGIKTGLLGSDGAIDMVAEQLRRRRLSAPIVIDPVLVAKSGKRILDDAAVAAVGRELLPLASLITPNVREAELLTGRQIHDRRDLAGAARALHDRGAAAVLIKGRDLPGPGATVIDLFFDGRTMTELPVERVTTGNLRGSGCTLSASILARLAGGAPPAVAVADARRWVVAILIASAQQRIGRGVGPLDHLAVPVVEAPGGAGSRGGSPSIA